MDELPEDKGRKHHHFQCKLIIKRGDCFEAKHFGPLYCVDTFRDGSGACVVGINSKDDVHYSCCIQDDVIRKLTRDEFDAMTHDCPTGES